MFTPMPFTAMLSHAACVQLSRSSLCPLKLPQISQTAHVTDLNIRLGKIYNTAARQFIFTSGKMICQGGGEMSSELWGLSSYA